MAIEASTKSLEMAPLNTYARLRVCSANIILGPDHYDKALEAWRASVATARFEPFLLLSRLHYGILLLQKMTPDDFAVIKDQLAVALWLE